ncbi:MAG TPA: PAS domain S-box protein [Candidatus Acidoferrum sp.]|nr:PAS domain S-box protein [Candidatus Acidoferrum sp.]
MGNPVLDQKGVAGPIPPSESAEIDSARQRYRLFFDSGLAGFIQTTWDGRIVDCNDACAHIFGYGSARELIGTSIIALYATSEDRAKFVNRLKQAKDILSYEQLLRKKDGTPVWVLGKIRAIRDESGTIKSAQGTMIDVTERKVAEEKFRKAFDANPEPVVIATVAEGRYIDVNESFLRATGYEREEVIGRTSRELGFWANPEDRKRLLETIDKQTGSLRNFEMTFQTKSGELRKGITSAEVIEINGVACTIAIFQDITDQALVEKQLHQAQKMESIGALAAGIAHEINTPIQFVGDNTRFLWDSFSGIADLIVKYEEFCKEYEHEPRAKERLEGVRAAREKADWDYMRTEMPKAMEQMMDGVERVATIVRAMKAFSHVDQGTEKAAADLNKALESTLIVARNELKYVADVETEFGELPPVPCHLGDVNQVFLNLLINAAHAIGDVVKDTQKKGQIFVRTTAEGDWAHIAISDTGTGIPEAIRNKIFDPFFTTKQVGKGTGQGLALARATIVDKHGGKLYFDSEVGKGTTFHVWLPTSGT